MGWTYLRDPALVLSPVVGWSLLAGPDPDWSPTYPLYPVPDRICCRGVPPAVIPYQTTDRVTYGMTLGDIYAVGHIETGYQCQPIPTAGVPQP